MQNIYKDIFNRINNKKINKELISENRYFSLVKIVHNNKNDYEYFIIRIWKNNLAEVFGYKKINSELKNVYSFSDGYEISNHKVKSKINLDFIECHNLVN